MANKKKNKIIKIVVAVVIVTVVFAVGFLIGYFSRRLSNQPAHTNCSTGVIGPAKAEQHKMFQERIETEKLEENVR